ncbi:SEC-C domain-containing protein [Candidatus Chloroploca sp. M-50]|uniref:SEC-C domain-containing protein n=1 Tax=Candidatus Chloroploca mongolica TaxID=2528176 RepID=A0ABS4DDM2_9CHLR|nr:SEC-C domain-containing protein [Candidatus Chloroploca mongolica]MBP1467532.1 SEC-C domain-containing protein [Candidatus Chloroploca mongolica]
MSNQPKRKAPKLGRNDPCHCGSGKKYKDCHLPLEQAERTEQMRLHQAQDTLLPRIIEAAQALPMQFPLALERFWQGKYQVEQLDELDTLEDRGAERFLTWFAFDLRQEDGRTLVEQLADDEAFELDPYERRLLQTWTTVRLRPYLVEMIKKGKGVIARDLLSDATYELADHKASRRLESGEVLVGHLIPVETPVGAEAPNYYLAGAAAQLTDDTAETLVAFAELHLADLRRTLPDAAWADLIKERSEIFNHFVTALPTEERDPTIFDRIISDGQIALKLTAANLAELLGRKPPDEEEEADSSPSS